jgi:diguanylate cyclase (GGDEF)-like protein
MSSEPPSDQIFSPERVFARACARMLVAGVVVFGASHLAVAHIAARQADALERAMETTATLAGARTSVAEIDRMAALPDGAARETVRNRVLRDIEAIEVGRDATGAPLGLGTESGIALSIASRENFAAGDAAALKEVFGGRILPRLEKVAAEARDAAARAVETGKLALLGSIVVNVLGAMLIVVGVAFPAYRRIGDWVRRSVEAEEDTRFRLLHDPLTGLPNRTYLDAYLLRVAAGSKRSGLQTAVLRLDLERFDTLRENLGQRDADEILRISARRIQQALRAVDMAAHLGQDDFVVVAGELEETNDAAAIAQRVMNALSKPYSIRGGARRIECRIGVTLLSDDVPDPARVLSNAAIALSEAQSHGPGSVRYFRESMREEVERRETLFSDLLHGLDAGQLVPFFQPQIDLKTGAFAGFEALVRWHHPERGLLSPAAFLEFADDTGLTERIGEVVLNASLGAIAAWDAAGLHVPKVGVNFALGQLRDPRLIEKIKWEVERCDVDPSRIAIEVLETVLIKSDQDMVVRNLRGLASAGFHIELDDFGTGHASISNLRRFMVNRIKIDRGFINGIEKSEELRTLTASMVAMAGALGIETLAEGVETEEAQAVVRSLGFGQLQGYLVAKPMSLADTFPWLRAWADTHRPLEDGRAQAAGDPNTP